jgi:hypothetical protein
MGAGGKENLSHKRKINYHTPLEWEEICIKYSKMRVLGISNSKAQEQLNVSKSALAKHYRQWIKDRIAERRNEYYKFCEEKLTAIQSIYVKALNKGNDRLALDCIEKEQELGERMGIYPTQNQVVEVKGPSIVDGLSAIMNKILEEEKPKEISGTYSVLPLQKADQKE